MKKLILCGALICSGFSFAQKYTTAVGLKGGTGASGINLKHDFGGIFGDFTVGLGSNYFGVSALGEKQQELKGNLDWYYGLGAYAYSYRNSFIYDNTIYPSGLGFGILGEVGLEYSFDEFPINIGLGVGPAFSLTPYADFGVNGTGAIRYIIK